MDKWLEEYLRQGGADASALRVALQTTRPAKLLRLLKSTRGSDSETAVSRAADAGHTEVLQLLLSPLRRAADDLLCVKDTRGWTALHCAAVSGHAKGIDVLLDSVSCNKKYEFMAERSNSGWTALAVAAGNGRTESVESLLNPLSSEERLSLIKTQDEHLDTALHDAAHMGQTAALQVLLSSVPPGSLTSLLNKKNRDRRTPLEEAEYEGERETAALISRWLKQPAIEALTLAHEKIAALQEADKEKTKALTAADGRIAALQKADKEKTIALAESEGRISRLQEESEQSTRRVVVLQEETRQLRADMAAMLAALARLEVRLRTPVDTGANGDQPHDPLS